MSKRTARVIVGLVAGSWMFAGAFLCRLPAAYAAGNDSPGKQMYLKYCSACHGESGKGDGVVSGFLQPKPTDLTQIAKKKGGEFPFMMVAEDIDGTNPVKAHGDPAMPVWGEVFRTDVSAPIARQAQIRGRIMLITDYVRSIQVK